MRNETFYATAAQVLPTILIALAVEANFLLRELRGLVDESLAEIRGRLDKMERSGKMRHGATFDELPFGAELARKEFVRDAQTLRYSRKVAQAAALLFLLGEFSCIAVLVFGTHGVLPLIAGPIVITVMVLLCVLAVYLPLLRIPPAQSLLDRPWEAPKYAPTKSDS